MILGYFNDTHLRASTPSCRKDKDFYANQLAKLREALELLARHEAFGLHGGDLMHQHNPPLSLLFDVLGVFKAREVYRWHQQFWVNPGNHDFFGGNTDTMRRSGLGLLEQAGSVSFMPRDFVWNDLGGWKIRLRSAPYAVSYPEDFYWFDDRKDDEVCVVVAHDMLTTRPVPFPHKEIKDVRTNADVVLCSHWHSQFVKKVGSTLFVNSGPMDVQAVDQRKISPAVAMVDIKGPGQVLAELRFLKTTGYEEVEIVEEEQKDLGLADDFIRMVQSSNLAEGASFEQAVIHVARESGHPQAVVDRVLGRIKEAQTCAGRE